MTSDEMLWFLGGSAYAVVAVRFACVMWRNEKRIGRRDKVIVMLAILWPLIAVVFGVGTFILADVGVMDSAYRHKAIPGRLSR